MKREHGVICACAVLLVLVVLFLTSDTLQAKAKAQLDVSAGTGDEGLLNLSVGDAPIKHGVTPGKYPVHVPRYAHMGRHRMYRHPGTCSPGNGAPNDVAYDWMFSPPSEGDL